MTATPLAVAESTMRTSDQGMRWSCATVRARWWSWNLARNDGTNHGTNALLRLLVWGVHTLWARICGYAN